MFNKGVKMANLLLYYTDIHGKLIFTIRAVILINLFILLFIPVLWWERITYQDAFRKIFNQLMILAIILIVVHILLPSADYTLYLHKAMKGF